MTATSRLLMSNRRVISTSCCTSSSSRFSSPFGEPTRNFSFEIKSSFLPRELVTGAAAQVGLKTLLPSR
jgi:hypothetical protein